MKNNTQIKAQKIQWDHENELELENLILQRRILALNLRISDYEELVISLNSLIRGLETDCKTQKEEMNKDYYNRHVYKHIEARRDRTKEIIKYLGRILSDFLD